MTYNDKTVRNTFYCILNVIQWGLSDDLVADLCENPVRKWNKAKEKIQKETYL